MTKNTVQDTVSPKMRRLMECVATDRRQTGVLSLAAVDASVEAADAVLAERGNDRPSMNDRAAVTREAEELCTR